MQLVDPNCMQCIYGNNCHAVETIQHALMACPRVKPLWDAIVDPWLQFGLRFDWTYILDITKVLPTPAWSHASTELTRLWTLLTGGMLRRLWLHRNKVKYERLFDLHVPSTVELILLQWSKQVRRHMQLPTTLDDERARIQTVTRRLGQHPSYQGFWSKYPLHFSVNPLTARVPFRQYPHIY